MEWPNEWQDEVTARDFRLDSKLGSAQDSHFGLIVWTQLLTFSKYTICYVLFTFATLRVVVAIPICNTM